MQVVTRGTEDGVQGVAQVAGEPAAIHAVIGLEMTDRWLDRLTSLEPPAVLPIERSDLAPVQDLDLWVVPIDPAKAQIDHHLFRHGTRVFEQKTGLLQLLAKDVSVIGIAGEGARSHHQPASMGHGNAGLDTKFVGLPGLAIADALAFGRVQGVELVLVVRC